MNSVDDYDFIVIGGGAAGLTAAGLAAHVGAKTIMIERDRLGGDCTWYGCIPSKVLLRCARAAHEVAAAHRFGIRVEENRIDFPEVMRLVRRTREQVYQDSDRPDIYEGYGVEVRQGVARFLDDRTIEISQGGTRSAIRGRYVVVATGSTPDLPPIDGLHSTPYLTNESVFELQEQPRHLIVIGAGPTGIEMAQAFRRLGSEVTVIEMADDILSRGDAEARSLLRRILEDEGIEFALGARVNRAEVSSMGVVVSVSAGGEPFEVNGSALLVAAGRRPRLDELNLNAAGIAHSHQGIHVDDACRTNVRHVFAVGDVTGRYQLTHMSEHMGKVAAMNALLKVPARIDSRHVPEAVFTDPELASVGATEESLRRSGTSHEVHRFPFSMVDRAVADQTPVGFIKILARKWSGKILGATIFGPGAGDLIAELTLAMKNGIPLRRISDTIHAYPTLALGVRRAADQWYVRRQSPVAVRAMKKVFGYGGRVPEYGPDDVL